MRKAYHAVSLLALAALLAAAAPAAERPPTRLYKVGDHWTAWDPPSEFPAGAELYVIVVDDTLWDLAGRFYGDPYLWPQLWERNRYILDAHWIYPGDPLVLGIEATPIDEIAEAGVGPGEPGDEGADGDGGLQLGRFRSEPTPLGSEEDLYCSGFIGPLDEGFARSIIGSEYENLAPDLGATSASISGAYGRVDSIKYDLSFGDVVYIDGGESAGLLPGDQFTVVAPGRKVEHPLSGEVLGRHWQSNGRLRVLSVQAETAIAEISYSCAPIHVGEKLRPFELEPVPLGRRTPMRGVNDPVPYEELAEAPAIVLSRSSLVSMGQDHVVFIDRGFEDEVTPGDLYTIYRPSAPGLPPVVIGQLAVLSVRPHTSLAKILESRYAVHIGDRLSLKAP